MHFGCVELVEQHGWTCSSRRARHVDRVVLRRDVTSQVEFGLYQTLLTILMHKCDYSTADRGKR